MMARPEDDGTAALMIVRQGTMRPRRDYKLWAPPPVTGAANHVLVVVGEDRGVGRSGHVNLLASALLIAGHQAAIVELSTVLSSAGRAHRATGSPIVLVDPTAPDWQVTLIDQVDQQFERMVILTVPALFWVSFARAERALLDTLRAVRPLVYLFVDGEGRAAKLTRHLEWLAAHAQPQFEHRLVLRGAPPDGRRRLVEPPFHHVATMPHLLPQVAERMFGRDTAPGSERHYATFHAAWDAATTGTRAVMLESVNRAFRDIFDLLGTAAYRLENDR